MRNLAAPASSSLRCLLTFSLLTTFSSFSIPKTDLLPVQFQATISSEFVGISTCTWSLTSQDNGLGARTEWYYMVWLLEPLFRLSFFKGKKPPNSHQSLYFTTAFTDHIIVARRQQSATGTNRLQLRTIPLKLLFMLCWVLNTLPNVWNLDQLGHARDPAKKAWEERQSLKQDLV